MTDPYGSQSQARGPSSRQLALKTTTSGMLQPTSLAEAIEVAKLFAHSGMLPKAYESNVGAVLVAMQLGAELGLGPLSAIQNIAVINGRPALWGDALLAVVTSHPECQDVVETSGEGWAKCVVKRRGRAPVERTFTVDDAKRAGLWGKQGPWQQYPARMLQQRARGFALRDSFPDALRGIRSVEEARDIVVEGGDLEVIEPGSVSEGTHRFGFKKSATQATAQSAAAVTVVEPPHDPKTGEVLDTKAKPPVSKAALDALVARQAKLAITAEEGENNG